MNEVERCLAEFKAVKWKAKRGLADGIDVLRARDRYIAALRAAGLFQGPWSVD